MLHFFFRVFFASMCCLSSSVSVDSEFSQKGAFYADESSITNAFGLGLDVVVFDESSVSSNTDSFLDDSFDQNVFDKVTFTSDLEEIPSASGDRELFSSSLFNQNERIIDLLSLIKVEEFTDDVQVLSNKKECLYYQFQPAAEVKVSLSSLSAASFSQRLSIVMHIKYQQVFVSNVLTVVDSHNIFQLRVLVGSNVIDVQLRLGTLQSHRFFIEELTDNVWHKISISIDSGRIRLYYNCREVSSLKIDDQYPLKIDSRSIVVIGGSLMPFEKSFQGGIQRLLIVDNTDSANICKNYFTCSSYSPSWVISTSIPESTNVPTTMYVPTTTPTQDTGSREDQRESTIITELYTVFEEQSMSTSIHFPTEKTKESIIETRTSIESTAVYTTNMYASSPTAESSTSTGDFLVTTETYVTPSYATQYVFSEGGTETPLVTMLTEFSETQEEVARTTGTKAVGDAFTGGTTIKNDITGVTPNNINSTVAIETGHPTGNLPTVSTELSEVTEFTLTTDASSLLTLHTNTQGNKGVTVDIQPSLPTVLPTKARTKQNSNKYLPPPTKENEIKIDVNEKIGDPKIEKDDKDREDKDDKTLVITKIDEDLKKDFVLSVKGYPGLTDAFVQDLLKYDDEYTVYHIIEDMKTEWPVIPGPMGPQGKRGQLGPPGPKGKKGDPGKKGSPGMKRTGYPGIPGMRGPPGPRGKHGIRGIRGRKGPIGSKGSLGLTGKRGLKGAFNCM
ncbi:collagen alpha-1(V) chain-like [Anneissia japonica]|uniref:collagen alpha-1(V) chain-like n=1 Tax=Anneissia japonica TaxID=1529436 RepID=UPI00142564BB|nr:collagen alpha-1(V) chain-like [Anneissia japonica]